MAPDLEEIVDVTFPRKVDEEEVIKLLRHICAETGYEVNVKPDNWLRFEASESGELGPVKTTTTESEFHGTIHDKYNVGYKFDRASNSDPDDRKYWFGAFTFQIAPCSGVHDIRPERLKIMETVRDAIKVYFDIHSVSAE